MKSTSSLRSVVFKFVAPVALFAAVFAMLGASEAQAQMRGGFSRARVSIVSGGLLQSSGHSCGRQTSSRHYHNHCYYEQPYYQQSYYQTSVTPTVVYPNSVVTANPVVVANPVVANPVPLADITLVNPAENGTTLSYTLDGMAYSLAPGYSQRVNQVCVIEFDRGGYAGLARFTISRGTYTFTVTNGAWNLVDSTYSTYSNSSPAAQPPLPGIAANPVPIQ